MTRKPVVQIGHDPVIAKRSPQVGRSPQCSVLPVARRFAEGYWRVPSFRQRTKVIAAIVLLALGVVGGLPPVPTSADPLPITQVTLRGGSNSILGNFGSIGLGFALSADTTFTVGATFSETLGLEPLVILTQTKQTGRDWTLSWTLSRGDFGGDYRVERVPEVTLTNGGNLANFGNLGYSIQAGVGHFLVRPAGLDLVRGALQAQLTTPAVPPGSLLGLSASTGYTEYIYSGSGALHSAWWGSVQLSVAPEAVLSTVFSYYRQVAYGTSPLLFDAIGSDHYVAGTATLKIGEAVVVQHSQTFSIVSQSISARVSTITVLLGPGQSTGISWDDIAQKLSFSYSRSDFGGFTLGWEVAIQQISIGYQR